MFIFEWKQLEVNTSCHSSNVNNFIRTLMVQLRHKKFMDPGVGTSCITKSHCLCGCRTTTYPRLLAKSLTLFFYSRRLCVHFGDKKNKAVSHEQDDFPASLFFQKKNDISKLCDFGWNRSICRSFGLHSRQKLCLFSNLSVVCPTLE